MINCFIRYWLAVIVWLALIFSLSSLSIFPHTVERVFSYDKIAHAVEYTVLGFLLARALKNSNNEKLSRNFRFFAMLFAVLYAASDEFHQSFVPLRHASFFDFTFDLIGAFLGQKLFNPNFTWAKFIRKDWLKKF